MKMVLSAANYTQYKLLQSFATIEKLNESVRAFLYKHKHELTESAVSVLKLLARHSCKIVGVSFLKVDTIAKLLTISTRTVRRALKVLSEQYRVIERKETIRTQGKLRGGNGHNVYVIKPGVTPDVLPELSPRVSDETPTEPTVAASKSEGETESSESSTLEELKNKTNVNKTSVGELLRNNKVNEENKEKEITLDDLDESFTPEVVPTEFKNAVLPFFDSANKIYELYKRVEVAYKRCKLQKSILSVIPEAIRSFQETIFAEKSNRIKTSFNGYFYRILEVKFMEERRRECRGDLFDFLSE
ncbi:helix-turn-helix domain-containing protein [Bacillus mycoides]|uniref:helix-turn-helix domain-containing protein n=1 Tax=Bacillus mycoides TaxID=1405 RepID=UPI002E1D7B7D|nr:helix-turn-helix domain-containing protein [Bacillus mycoides]